MIDVLKTIFISLFFISLILVVLVFDILLLASIDYLLDLGTVAKVRSVVPKCKRLNKAVEKIEEFDKKMESIENEQNL